MDLKKKVGELLSMNSERPGVIHIFEGEKVTIGRDQANTNRIDDNRIAQFHCSVFFQDGQVVLKNLCTQGTFLNKEKMGLDLEVNLKHGDHIHLLCQKGKKVTEKHVIAYMFFKLENKKQSLLKSSKCSQPVLEQMSDDLICIICQEIYYEGVTVSPCGHVFCGYCLQGWEDKNNTCPICRLKITNITKAFQINKIISTFLELNPDVEQKEKPANKYFLYASQNDDQSESHNGSDNDNDSGIDNDSDMVIEESDSDIENELIRRMYIDQLNRRQQNLNNNIVGVLALDNQQIRQFNLRGIFNPQPIFPQVQQVQQPQVIQRPVDQPQNRQQNIQQNAQAQQNRQQNPQQNAQQNAQAQNAQAQNAQANQLRINNQPPQIDQPRVNNPILNNNQQRPHINAQVNQHRADQPPQNQQNAQINQRGANPLLNPQINQQRANPHPNLQQNQVAQQNQQREIPPPPVVVVQQNGQIIHPIPNPPQNQNEQQIQVRVNINPPQQQIAQAPLRQNQMEDNNRQNIQVQAQQRQVNIQVQIHQPAQPQNQIRQIFQPQQPQQRNANQLAPQNKDCRSCIVEYKGFKCQPFPLHLLCQCLTRMPLRNLNIHENVDLKMFCQVCKSYFCKFYYGQQCEQVQSCDINELNSYREGFSFQDQYFNNIEKRRIYSHLNGQSQTTIFDFIMQHYISRSQFYFQKNKALYLIVQNEQNELLLPNSPVCTRCMKDVKNQIVFRYVQTLKYEEIQFMMTAGMNDDVQHAVSFNHICEQTKFD